MIPHLPAGLAVGEYAPWFACPTPSNRNYSFSTMAGRYVLLGFLPGDEAAHRQAGAVIHADRSRFDDHNLTCFVMLRDAAQAAQARNQIPGLRWGFDTGAEFARLYGVEDAPAVWFLLDPALRILAIEPMAEPQRILAHLAALPRVEDYADAPLVAPVLIVPRVFEPDLCRRLIAYYDERGGAPSGVMRDIEGKTVGVLDDFKNRRDVFVQEEALRDELLKRLRRRLLPEIRKAFHFATTRLERYLIACYDAEEGGYFKPHRDNTTFATAHRRFAVSINLNAEDFEGGDLRFPEFGQRTYRPPTGGAVVFGCSLLHEATRVTRGRRYAFLPFLYDEEGARIREENLHRLEVQGG